MQVAGVLMPQAVFIPSAAREPYGYRFLSRAQRGNSIAAMILKIDDLKDQRRNWAQIPENHCYGHRIFVAIGLPPLRRTQGRDKNKKLASDLTSYPTIALEGRLMYRVSDFAEKAGVTVRTLHHYDRLGLLKPSRRTEAGYRLYDERDFGRLQQIVTLKFIGLPLKQIKDLLDGSDLDLAATLRLQRRLLLEKRLQMEAAIQAIEEAEQSLKSSRVPDLVALKKIIEVMERQTAMEWTKKYYSEEAQAKIAERAKTFTPEMQAKVTQDWNDLIHDVESAISSHEDPGSAKARELAERWSSFTRGFTGGDPEVQKGLNKLYSDPGGWPASFNKPWSDDVEVFIKKAMAAHKTSCT
jgi:MerR family transcriptional regulator, thiopeptide resistance regulator